MADKEEVYTDDNDDITEIPKDHVSLGAKETAFFAILMSNSNSDTTIVKNNTHQKNRRPNSGRNNSNTKNPCSSRESYAKPFYWDNGRTDEFSSKSGPSHNSGESKNRSYKNDRRITCRYCHKKGHIERECRKKKKDEEFYVPTPYVQSSTIIASTAPNMKHFFDSLKQETSSESQPREYVKVPIPIKVEKDGRMEFSALPYIKRGKMSNMLKPSSNPIQMPPEQDKEKDEKNPLNLVNDPNADDPHYVRDKNGKLVYRQLSSSDEDYSSDEDMGDDSQNDENAATAEVAQDEPMEEGSATKPEVIEEPKFVKPKPPKIESRDDLLNLIKESGRNPPKSSISRLSSGQLATDNKIEQEKSESHETEPFKDLSCPNETIVAEPFTTPKFDLDEFMTDLDGLSIEKAPEPVAPEAKFVKSFDDHPSNSYNFEKTRKKYKSSNFVPIKFVKAQEYLFMDMDDSDYDIIGNSVDFESRQESPKRIDESEEGVWTDTSDEDVPIIDSDEEVLPKHNPWSAKSTEDKKSHAENPWQQIAKSMIQKDLRTIEKKMKLDSQNRDNDGTDTETLRGSDPDTDVERDVNLSPAKTQPSDSETEKSPFKKPPSPVEELSDEVE